ncbi:hypothetical protein [Ahrensia sp. 13_GOM-1096m]|uniref:hypothetical protein n=1 Tax=Ahrensia sp. 13_GOM-1096m TaxID=1380380 RepID=UPI000478921E|nr:hypothetical protein [Ahrensia sp. 13_GOM-1096m]
MAKSTDHTEWATQIINDADETLDADQKNLKQAILLISELAKLEHGIADAYANDVVRQHGGIEKTPTDAITGAEMRMATALYLQNMVNALANGRQHPIRRLLKGIKKGTDEPLSADAELIKLAFTSAFVDELTLKHSKSEEAAFEIAAEIQHKIGNGKRLSTTDRKNVAGALKKKVTRNREKHCSKAPWLDGEALARNSFREEPYERIVYRYELLIARNTGPAQVEKLMLRLRKRRQG